MKKIIQNAAVLLLLAVLNSQFSTAHAQGTAFTYQGQLQNNGSPASGTYNLTFALFNNTNAGAPPIAGPVTNTGVIVSNGLFTVQIDFGSTAFIGQSNWLEIAVATNLTSSFTTLAPRQQLTPTPYAIYSANAGNATTAASATAASTATIANNFSGGLTGDVTGTQVATVVSAVGGQTAANVANGASAANNATSANTPSTIVQRDGSGNISVGTVTANAFSGNGGGLTNLNVIASQLTSIGNTNGGIGNFFVGPSGNATTSGYYNTAAGYEAFASNTTGLGNSSDGFLSLNGNTSGSQNTAVGGAALSANTIGSGNTAVGYQALVVNTSGSVNTALGYQAGYLVTTGSSNIDIGNQGFSTDTNIIRIGNGQSQTYIAGNINGNGGGLTNLNASQLTSIGNNNVGSIDNFFVGPSGNSTMSGSANTADGTFALLANTSGSANMANGYDTLRLNTNGSLNTADGAFALFANTSGSNNIALGYEAGLSITTGSANIDIGNQGVSTDANIIRLGSGQSQAYIAGVINGNGGGLTNLNAATLASGAAVGAGLANLISSSGATDSFIGGGGTNSIQFNSLDSFIGGGANNTNFSNAGYSVIGGGTDNQTASGWSFIGGGNGNVIGSATLDSTIGGGYANTNSGSYATVPGGSQNLASGKFSFAAGDEAQATNSGAFVWADAEGTAFASTTTNQFSVRANGGVQFVTGGTGVTVDGLLMTSNNLQAGGNMNIKSGLAMDLTSATTMQVGSSSTTTINGLLGVNIQSAGNSVSVSPAGVTLTGTILQFQSPAIMNSMLTVAGLTTLGGGLIANGSVGIGTSSPEQALSVVGGMNVDAGNANNGPVGSGGFNQGGPTNGCLTFGTSSTGTGFSGEGIQSKRTSGGTQYDLEFFTGFNKQMVILNNGNVGIGNTNPIDPLEMGSGAYCSAAGAWTSVSDRNAKEDFSAIKPAEVLAKVAALPITEWKYKVEAYGTEHLGPMAQDFHAAFGLNGTDDKHISVVDEGGVALAAIQGLNQKLQEKDAKIGELEKRLDELEAKVKQLAANK
jgi:hypothetical protein